MRSLPEAGYKVSGHNMGNVIRYVQLEVQPVSETDLLDPDIIL